MSAPQAQDYFESAFAQFKRGAESRGTLIPRVFGIAGRRIRIETTSAVMDRALWPGLSHLAVSEDITPDLTLAAWDGGHADAQLRPGWSADDYGVDGLVRGWNDSRFHTAIQRDPIIFRMLDRSSRRAIYWTPAAARLPHWELGAPLRPLLHAWLLGEGLTPIHGGAVGTPECGVLLAGAGGAGKSNLALACLNFGLRYASDDFCVLSESPGWRVHSLYCTGKIAAADLERHPGLAGAESNPGRLDREKALFFLQERFAEKLIRAMPVRAIVLPQVLGHGESALHPAARAAAQKAIALSTMELSRWTAAATFARVAKLARALPCYELRMGRSLEDAAGRLAALIDELR